MGGLSHILRAIVAPMMLVLALAATQVSADLHDHEPKIAAHPDQHDHDHSRPDVKHDGCHDAVTCSGALVVANSLCCGFAFHGSDAFALERHPLRPMVIIGFDPPPPRLS